MRIALQSYNEIDGIVAYFSESDIYCRMPARWGLQQTTRAPDSDKTQGQGSLNLVIAIYKIFF